MTVKELITLLQELPQDLPVYLGDWNEEYAPDISIDYVSPDGEKKLLPGVVEATLDLPEWDLPKRVVIG